MECQRSCKQGENQIWALATRNARDGKMVYSVRGEYRRRRFLAAGCQNATAGLARSLFVLYEVARLIDTPISRKALSRRRRHGRVVSRSRDGSLLGGRDAFRADFYNCCDVRRDKAVRSSHGGYVALSLAGMARSMRRCPAVYSSAVGSGRCMGVVFHSQKSAKRGSP